MSIRINLLPPEMIARQEQKRVQRQLITAGGIVLVFFGAVFGTLFAATLFTRAEANQIKEQRQAVEQEARAYEPYATMQNRIYHLEGLVQKVMGTTPDWLAVMTDIGLYLPVNVWLTDFTASYENDPSGQEQSGAGSAGEIVIRGLTYDHYAVAGWLEEIKAAPEIHDVLCQFSSAEDYQGEAMVRFEIKAGLQPRANSPAAGKAGD